MLSQSLAKDDVPLNSLRISRPRNCVEEGARRYIRRSIVVVNTRSSGAAVRLIENRKGQSVARSHERKSQNLPSRRVRVDSKQRALRSEDGQIKSNTSGAESSTPAACLAYADTELDCYRWLIPKRFCGMSSPTSVQNTFRELPRGNRRNEVVCLKGNPTGPQCRQTVMLQPKSLMGNPRTATPNQRLTIQSREEFQPRHQQKLRPTGSTVNPTNGGVKKIKGGSRSSLLSIESGYRRLCPTCFPGEESDNSDGSSSDGDSGSDTSDDDDPGQANQNDLQDTDSLASDLEDSGGGSDSGSDSDSMDSLDGDMSINSSVFDEDIMIEEEEAPGDVGSHSDDNFELERGDHGSSQFSGESVTDFDEYSRGDDDDALYRQYIHD